MVRNVRAIFFAIGTFLFVGQSLPAHQQPTTLLLLDIGTERVGMQVHVPLTELELAFGHGVSNNPEANLAHWEAAFREYLLHHTRPSTNGSAWQVRVLRVTLQRAEQKQSGPFQEVLASLELTPPEGVGPRNFLLHYDAILHQVVTHKVLVSIRNDWQTGRTSSAPLQVSGIQVDNETAKIAPLRVELDAGSRWTGFRRMVVLGVEHIREGTDHILFLLTLLLPATLTIRRTSQGKNRGEFGGVRYGLTRVFRVVTAFTVGHSITLLAGALEWVRLPQQPVEVLIAMSILFSAIHAMRPVFPSKEAFAAAGFGLVHGLGFASGLAELHLDSGSMALSILGFNLGIEAMQLFVIALTMPWILLLSVTAIGDWVRIGGATMAAIAALGWIANRVSGDPNAIEQWSATAARFSLYGIPVLALIAIPAFLLAQKNSLYDDSH